MKEITFKWENITDLIPVKDKQGDVGLLTKEQWYDATMRAEQVITEKVVNPIMEGEEQRQRTA